MGTFISQSFGDLWTLANLRGARVLLLEDHDASREALVRLLGSNGMSVVSASCIREALEAFERTPPRLIVSDMHLPDGDGCDFIARVRALGHGVLVPAVAVTALLLPEVRLRALKAGFQACLAKCDIDALLRRLSTLLAESAGGVGGRFQTA